MFRKKDRGGAYIYSKKCDFCKYKNVYMTVDNFMAYLQQLLTIVDTGNKESVDLAKQALTATVALARLSQNVDDMTDHLMDVAVERFPYLIEHARDFAGEHGDVHLNMARRRTLELTLYPHC